MLFKDIVGQNSLKAQLLHAANTGRVAHAQLLLGPEGSGALPLAIAYAQYLNCEYKQEQDSCGTCSSCRKYEKYIHPDLHFIFPFFPKDKTDTSFNYYPEWRSALIQNPYLEIEEWREVLEVENKQANINIHTCHEVIKKLSLKAFEATYKVMIMWLPEYLDKEGNSLLKIIEEPPANTLFLLVAQKQEQLLNTIRSRTQLIKVPKVNDADVLDYLTNQKAIAQTDAQEIMFLAQGNITKAQQLIAHKEQSYNEFFKDWMRCCWANNGLKIIEMVDVFAKLGRENQKEFFGYAMGIFRETVVYHQGAKALLRINDEEQEFISKFATLVHPGNATPMVAELEKAYYHIERNANPKILFLDLSLTFLRLIQLKNVNSLLSYAN